MKRYTIDVRNEAPAPYNRWRAFIEWPNGAREATSTYASEAEALREALVFLTSWTQPVKAARV